MARRNDDVIARGGQTVSILMDGRDPGTAPTRGNLNSWINTPSLPFTTVLDNIDTPDSFTAYYSTGVDNFFVYDLATMQLVGQFFDLADALAVFDPLLDAGKP